MVFQAAPDSSKAEELIAEHQKIKANLGTVIFSLEKPPSGTEATNHESVHALYSICRFIEAHEAKEEALFQLLKNTEAIS